MKQHISDTLIFLVAVLMIIMSGCNVPRQPAGYVPDDVRYSVQGYTPLTGYQQFENESSLQFTEDSKPETYEHSIDTVPAGFFDIKCDHVYVEIMSTDPTPKIISSIGTTSPQKDCICLFCHVKNKCY